MLALWQHMEKDVWDLIEYNFDSRQEWDVDAKIKKKHNFFL